MYKYWEIWVICANEAIYHFILITVYDESATKHWCLKLSVRTISNNVDVLHGQKSIETARNVISLIMWGLSVTHVSVWSSTRIDWLLLSVFVWSTHLCLYSCEQTGSCRVKAHYNFCGKWTLAICHNHGEGWGQGFLKGRALAPRVGLKVHITLVPYLSTKRSPSGHLRDKGSSYSCTCLTLETPYKEKYSLCWGTGSAHHSYALGVIVSLLFLSPWQQHTGFLSTVQTVQKRIRSPSTSATCHWMCSTCGENKPLENYS